MYNYIYYAVCDWDKIVIAYNRKTGSFVAILQYLLDMYNQLVVVDSGCNFQTYWQEFSNNLLNKNQFYATNFKYNLLANTITITKHVIILIYAIAWQNYLDIGLAVGVLASRPWNVYLEQVNPNPPNWVWISKDFY